MNAKERQRMQRLEIENKHLRHSLEHVQTVNRNMLYELVDMKTKLELCDLAIHGDPYEESNV